LLVLSELSFLDLASHLAVELVLWLTASWYKCCSLELKDLLSGVWPPSDGNLRPFSVPQFALGLLTAEVFSGLSVDLNHALSVDMPRVRHHSLVTWRTICGNVLVAAHYPLLDLGLEVMGTGVC